MDYPPNHKRETAPEPPEDKKIEKIVTGEAVRRKKPLGKQFASTFAGGDLKSAMRYVLFDVLIPAAKDAVVDAGSQGIERLIFGESRRKRPSGVPGYVSYNRFSRPNDDRPPMPSYRPMSRRARATHDFDEIVLMSRPEAENVIDRLFDLISRYDIASIADLYELVGIKGSHTDNKWGWSDIRGAGVVKVRNGFLLDLPEPEPLD